MVELQANGPLQRVAAHVLLATAAVCGGLACAGAPTRGTVAAPSPAPAIVDLPAAATPVDGVAPASPTPEKPAPPRILRPTPALFDGARPTYAPPIVAADLGAVVLAISAAGADAPVLGVTAATVWLLVPPAIHFRYQDGVGTSLQSLALRVGGPVAGIVGGMGAAKLFCDPQGSKYGCPLELQLLGALGGVVGTSLLDAIILAREPRLPSRSSVSLIPDFRASGDSGWFGLSGRF